MLEVPGLVTPLAARGTTLLLHWAGEYQAYWTHAEKGTQYKGTH